MGNSAVFASAWWLIGIGLVALMLIIPLLGCWLRNTETKTEFFSARGAYWCVIMGLVLLAIAVLGTQVENIVAVLRSK
jgi:hypothetical protein